ncbi:MAG: 3-hydroxyacyl-ACP dehydratase FabZ, partial [Oligoflexales bacterium]|nr:3-hydroxyacyl-ACP dehydratase FabZ [Oligoflexales bacterium]
IIPHRHGFLLIDKVVELVPGVSGKGIKCVSFNEPFFKGHFPGLPVMPGVLIAESIAQTCAVVLASEFMPDAGQPGGDLPTGMERGVFLATIKDMRFFRPVIPGDTLVVHVEVERKFRNLAIIKGKVMVGDVKAVEGSLTLAVAG